MIRHHIRVAQAVASSIAQGGRGLMGTPYPCQPEKALKLYEFEGSPFCRRVREVLTCLNLDYEVYPCPKNGKKYRALVKQLGGKTQFPFLVDENTGAKLYESEAIIHYLFQHYSRKGKTPEQFTQYPKIPMVALAGTLLNGARGVWIDKKIIDRAAPEHLIELWGFEASPYTRVVRAVLTELELPFIFHNVAKERWQDAGLAKLRLKPGKYVPLVGGKREKLQDVMGENIQVPYLVDPNTGVSMFESKDIVDYLHATYGQ